jgi:hypothetical protein
MKYERIVGNWVLEWQTDRPSIVWVISNHRHYPRRSQSVIQYGDGTLGWDYLPDRNLEIAVTKFFRDIKTAVPA